ncbi:ABC transporter permease [Tepidimonas aquatica]|uniref:Uncharacterized protein n=3 Tax=Tepidimonas TaxID=114248 RepID=A0A554XHM7_9BURK|nr:ABC transporter permease [Tepidimonas aquatica]TSE23825.1 hypothetical protein Taqua_01712 [Tepidimonas aquatica]TSE35334.1 hypothetical protein Tfont_02308 [Tepidimonas fonticaldi]
MVHPLPSAADSARRQTWRFVVLLARQRLIEAYRGAGLGAWWSILPQLAQIGTLALILGAVMQHRLGAAAGGPPVPYVVYMLPGVLLWQLFHDTLLHVADALPAQRLILKKNAVDLAVLPLYVPLAQMAPFAVGLALLWLLVSVLWQPIGVHVIGVTVLAAAALLALAYCIGWVWGSLAVIVPDIRHALAPLLQVGFWLTPIVYPASLIPAPLHGVLAWGHPWYGLIAPVQAAWTGLPASVPPSAALLPLLLGAIHALVLRRIVRHGRKLLLDAL